MADPEVNPSTEEERRLARALEWAEHNVQFDRRGRVAMRPPLRTPVLAGLGLALIAAATAAISGNPAAIAVPLAVALVVGLGALVVGLVVWTVGWASGPKGAFADHNGTRRAGVVILKVAVAGFIMVLGLRGADALLSGLDVYRS